MLPSVTSVHKGLTPSGNISCITLPFNTENLYFKHFFIAFTKVCTCSCWAHTQYILQGGVGGTPTVDTRFAVPSYRTGTLFEIRNDNLQVTVVVHFDEPKRIAKLFLKFKKLK